MKNKVLKGFTLIELIIVLAIFSIILTLVMSFIDPATRLMKSTSVKEKTGAYVDNVSEYLENSLRYAKFVHIYDGEEPSVYQIRDIVSLNLNGAVTIKDNSGTPYPVEGNVRVLKMDNSDGQIYEKVYKFTTQDSRLGSIEPEDLMSSVPVQDWTPVLNKEHFQDYSFYYKAGYYNFEPVASADNRPENYKSHLVEMTDKDGNVLQNGRPNAYNFSMSVVAYGTENGVNAEATDGDVTTEPEFQYPARMDTVSMAFINIINATSSQPCYRQKYETDPLTLAINPVFDPTNHRPVFEQVNPARAFHYYKPADGAPNNDNIYIVFINPSEMNDNMLIID